MAEVEGNKKDTEGGVDDDDVVTHETLTPPVGSVFAFFSKTTEFDWKLTKLPMNPNDVEAIKFETRVDDAVSFNLRKFISPATWKLETKRTADGGLTFWLNFVSFGVSFRPEGTTVECELCVRQKEGQTVPCVFQLDKTKLESIVVESGQLLKIRPPGNEYEPLILKKNTVALWLKFKFVHFASRRMDLDLEGQRAMKRRRLNETSGIQVGADIGKILKSKAGADCTMKTSCGKVFDVHRCILAARSPVLAELVEPNWLRGDGLQETIVLKDIGAKAFEFLLKFIYTGSLESVVGLDCDAVKEILDACSKYQFPMMKEHMDKSMVEVCSVGNAMRLHDVAVLHNLNEAAKGIEEFIGKNVHEVLMARPRLS